MVARGFGFVTRTALLLLAGTLSPAGSMAQGVVLPGVGPINRSIGGASVAAPIDAIGALHWNPATIGALKESEIGFGAEFLRSRTTLSSRLPGSSLGPAFPPVDLAGSTGSDSGVNILPSIAVVHRRGDSRWTYGLGVLAIGGFGANFPSESSNPILSPPPPNGFGLGAVFSGLSLLQIAPTFAYRVTEKLSVGLAPTVTVAYLSLDPGVFAAPDDANGDTFPTYPPATRTRAHWGGGGQAGIYYRPDGRWRFGASIKSPQWFETFEFNSSDELGRNRALTLEIDYPLVASVGTAFDATPDLLVTVDLRYIDYENTRGFGSPAEFEPTGAAAGLGWRGIWAVAAGAQYRWSDRASMRLGYLYNQKPFPDESTFFNIASSAIFQNAVFAGASLRVTERLTAAVAYLHAFENASVGPFETPGGTVPGASVGAVQVTDAVVVGMYIKF